MADLHSTISTPSAGVTIAADSNPHTIVQALMPSNHRGKLKKITIGFEGTTVTNKPLIVELVKQSTAGTGGTSATPRCTNEVAETPQISGLYGAFSAEPTLTHVIETWTIHPQLNGGFALPLGHEYIVPGGGRMAVRVTDPQSNGNVAHCSMSFEE